MINAIIFDMDGVITDTEYEDFKIVKDFIRVEGGTTDEKELFTLVGKSYTNLFTSMKDLIGTSATVTEVERRYYDFVADKYDQLDYQAIFRQDIIQILDYADEKEIKLAVASSSTLEHIKHILTVCGIIERFDAIVSGEVFAESKPHPEIYQHTMSLLNVSPDNCVAIEDSYYGIQAATSAGISVIAYEEIRLGVDQSQAKAKGKNMTAILEIIKQWHEN